MQLPIVEHLEHHLSPEGEDRVLQLADQLRNEQPGLAIPAEFQQLKPSHLREGPALHLDDLSEITQVNTSRDMRFYQDRARLRAGDGDLLASCADPVEGVEDYLRDILKLGAPDWLRPPPPQNSLRIAEACWENEEVRHTLIRRVEKEELAYLHPHMGTLAVWELAALLTRETGRAVHVIAPPPELASWVNNKVAFTDAVRRLFDAEAIPVTQSAWNLTMLAQRVKEMIEETKAQTIGLKLPDAVGGGGNTLLQTGPLRGASLSEVDDAVQQAIAALGWEGDQEILVDVWEANVLSSPSVQVWIPPERDGRPLIEGIFTQVMEGDKGVFVGTVPADLPEPVRDVIVERCAGLARLFQRLGYIGRCSFDLLLVGSDLENSRAEFIECNGRWGGTSLPMTLMNRLFGDWIKQPFAVQVFHHIPGLDQVSFPRLVETFREDLFDAGTRQGSLIFFDTGRLKYQAGLSVIFLGKSQEDATGPVRRRFTDRLVELARESATGRSVDSDIV